MPLVSAFTGPLVRRYRYACADCHWTGWKPRLRRRSDAGTVTLQQRTQPESRALWFFIAVVGFLLVTTVLLMRSCEPRPSDTGTVSLNR
jgi:hypothetical protein